MSVCPDRKPVCVLLCLSAVSPDRKPVGVLFVESVHSEPRQEAFCLRHFVMHTYVRVHLVDCLKIKHWCCVKIKASFTRIRIPW